MYEEELKTRVRLEEEFAEYRGIYLLVEWLGVLLRKFDFKISFFWSYWWIREFMWNRGTSRETTQRSYLVIEQQGQRT